MRIEWTSKMGNSAKPFRVGLTNGTGLLTFSSVAGPDGTGVPQLSLRRRHEAADTAVTFDLAEYVDADGTYNAERYFTPTDFASLSAGIYVAEVVGTISGQAVTFPDERNPLIRFLP